MSMRYQGGFLTASYFPLLAPDAPTIGTATAGSASASVTFTAPTNTGGGAITGYTVTSSPGNFTGTGSSSPITVSGLTDGTAYTFTVTATNAYGTSTRSASSNSITPLSAPVNITLPDISPMATIPGVTIAAGTGTWSFSPTSYAYQWRRGGTPISGATNNSYTTQTADIGFYLTVTVTATNAGGSTPATSAGLGPINSATSDPYWANVSSLQPFNGAITDVGPLGIGFTSSGGAATSTTQKKYGSASLFTNGTNQFIFAANNSAYRFGTGDFTVEWWMYANTAWTSQIDPGIAGQKADDTTSGWQIYRNTGDPNMYIRIIGETDYSSNVVPATNTWESFAVTRSSGTLRWFKNGVITATYTGVTGNINDTTGTFRVGNTQTWGGYYNGYIDELRITKGVARYTQNYTPSSVAFPTA